MNYTFESAVYAVMIAFVACIALCPVFIPYLTKLKFGQNVRDDGPQSHIKKTGTPTMGGIVIVLSFAAASLFFVAGNGAAAVVLLVTVGYGIIGFIDDYIKVVKRRSLGLRAYQKLLMQVVITCLFAYYLYFMSDVDTRIYVPFTDGFYLDLGGLYLPFLFLVMVGTVNGVNLTDGLDGLASGVTVLVATFFLFIAQGAASGTVPVIGAAVGSLLGFLLFNSYPARVFMGDTGSLALGGFIAAVAVLLKMPLMIVVVGLAYVLESLSVMIQVGYFKLTRGKRFFKMAPLHHHFELSGWSETKVVMLFYVGTAIMCLIGYLGS
ncbi:MAG: phospho-N-acetylmuramoyl-pentapeptide-transferase [Clostridiales bacterium]|jgi:phospho-N-acetylmuramoyl-pentapeptide-transferase|nr:phospho-N-acetylmuramoyl-pentapeptide-transferase [Clostridiales bacterium]